MYYVLFVYYVFVYYVFVYYVFVYYVLFIIIVTVGYYCRMQNELNELIRYSEKYNDSVYEYRHVTLPVAISKKVSSTC